MNALEARTLLFQRKLAYEDINIPGLPELDGQLGVLALTAKAVSDIDKLSKGEDGEDDEALKVVGMFVRSLVMRETKERVFADNDMGSISEEFGLDVLMPVAQVVKRLSGMDEQALEQAKKN